ncbi:hypothetical protein BJY01DRAFT_242911 [Aspergillus pseudoustus]|uniref:Glycosyl transferase family 25 domain-containing protein n=1 Tax=Aspergillus pseudoustus TaxID=1810923 RepID=A0ABR4KXI3_9EURO
MAWSTSQRGLARLMLYAVGVVIIISLIFWSHPLTLGTDSERVGSEPVEGSDDLHSITNETLGMQKIFAISLPSRLDKRDNIVLGSSLSDFHVDFLDAITPDQVNPKIYPYNWNYDHRPVEFAARRSHLNALQKIVHESLGSAIVMEDDADWDVSLKTQLQSFAIAVRALQSADSQTSSSSSTTNSQSDSPYGPDWDILWLGHCGIDCLPPTTHPSFVTDTDPTTPQPHHFLPYWRDTPPQADSLPASSRLTCRITDGVCSLLYAVSLRGARRILAALSVDPSEVASNGEIDTGAQFDVSLGRLCGSGSLTCFAAYPALTGGYEAPRAAGKGSDINGAAGNQEKPFEGEIQGAGSHGVVYSTMLNIARLLRGDDTVRATWEDVIRTEASLGDFEVRGGSILPTVGVV